MREVPSSCIMLTLSATGFVFVAVVVVVVVFWLVRREKVEGGGGGWREFRARSITLQQLKL